MRLLMRWLAATLFVVGNAAPAWAQIEIPEFTPNVVDPGVFLGAEGAEAVNAEIERIRAESNIWGAVYVVDTLHGEAIEEVAVKAFEKWKLGQAGVDNGLLLVLAMNDRKSRFEVGYGLEGTITDVAALRALDAYLAPKMREGDPAGAIVDSFAFLSRLVAQDPGAMAELQFAATEEQQEGGDEFNWRRGLSALGAYLAALWLCAPIARRVSAWRRQRLMDEHPALLLKDDSVTGKTPEAAKDKTSWFLLAFLSLNPGIFVLLFSALEPGAYAYCLAIPPAIAALVIGLSGRRYGSPGRYQKFLDDVIKQRAKLIEKGHLEESSPGVFRYTPAYHAAQAAARSSSSSSSSSGSRSSSSGGGRSGGGGASSGW